ncbi:hypothetical protein J7M28_12085 [bacterium]|nr:hypothetical protein [bacterium]
MHRRKTMVLIAILFVALSLKASATEYHVKRDGLGDFILIQDAIDASVDGDEIIVHPGTYFENIFFWGRNITLRSTGPEDEQVVASTVIDGGQNGSVVTFMGSEWESCVLSGFTITNGFARNGGGIQGNSQSYYEFGTRAQIAHCIITGCRGEYGGGIYGCSGTISDCLIQDNVADCGGGLRECGETIENCTIRNNVAEDSGGGIYRGTGKLVNCTITENRAGNGGGMYSPGYNILNCIISNNTAGDVGGGIFSNTFEKGRIDNCRIIGNSAHSGGGINGFRRVINTSIIALNNATYGAGAASCSGTIANCLIGHNSAELDGGGLCWCHGTIINCSVVGNWAGQSGIGLQDCTAEIANCIVWGNESQGQAQLALSSIPSYSCIQGWNEGGDGNISDDPLFVSPDDADYRLRGGSPCINRGSDSAAFGETDVDGNPRAISLGVDMGAYEHTNGCSVAVFTDSGYYYRTDTMILSASGFNYGDPQQVDLYAAIQTCSGELLFIPSLSLECLPWVSGLELSSDSEWGPQDFAYQFSGFERMETIVAYAALFQHDSMIIQSNLDRWVFHYDRGYNSSLTVKQDGTGNFTGIRQAMCCAIDGDTIAVHPGVYYENIELGGKNIVITSINPDDPEIVASTIIDGCQNASVISFDGTENDTCEIRGFTITNGLAENGGGIYGAQSGNSSYYDRSYAQIINCTISNNVATAFGGGVYFWGGAIDGCTIVGNRALYGGGLNDCHDITNCVIQGNSATADGGGLTYCYKGAHNCLIVDNTAAGPGGGLYDVKGLLSSCTIAFNGADIGGGMSTFTGGITNCIIWGNEARIYSQMHGSSDASFSCIQDYSTGIEGCITDDPQFVSGPLGEHYLYPNSKCIDSGGWSAVYAEVSDRTTQADGTADSGLVDMGFHYPIPAEKR